MASDKSLPGSPTRSHSNEDTAHASDAVHVEALVEHLLAAKRALSSMQHVLRASDLATHARQAHEEAAILAVQTAFVRRAVARQARLLRRLRHGLKKTYDGGKRDFGGLVRTMDATNEKLQETIDMLRATGVEPAFRPDGEEQKNLMDFVDERGVHSVVDSLKKCLAELQSIQTSFDGDLLRFDNDFRALKKAATEAPNRPSPDPPEPMPDILLSLVDHSHAMAESLASLTSHFDLCVTAVRTTEGGADLARRRAAEVTQAQGPGDGVSISGVIADQEARVSDLEPVTAQDRAEMLDIVVGDAAQVDSVVDEIHGRLRAAEEDFAALTTQSQRIQAAHGGAATALRALDDIGSRLAGYLAAETEFTQRWEDERRTIYEKLEEMDALRGFYEGYANAYDSMLLEAERRRMDEEKQAAIWRRARDSVEKLIEADRREREAFRQDVGEYIPTDLWPAMDAPLRRFKLAAVEEEDGDSTPALDRRVVDAARQRLEQRHEP